MSWQIWLYILLYPINSITVSFELRQLSKNYWIVLIELLSGFYQEIQLVWFLISLICFVIIWDILDIFKLGPFKLIENNEYPWSQKALLVMIDTAFKFPALIAISAVIHALNT